MSCNNTLTSAWKYIARALTFVKILRNVSVTVQLWHRAYGYQPTEGISTATVTHAALYGETLLLDVVFPLLPLKPAGVFELLPSSVRDMYSNRPLKFNDPAKLHGALIHLHTGPQFQHDGYPRSRVIGIKVLSTLQPN